MYEMRGDNFLASFLTFALALVLVGAEATPLRLILRFAIKG
jgi:hypothetical protein